MRTSRPNPVASQLAAEYGGRMPASRISAAVDALAATAEAERDPLALEHLARAELARQSGDSRRHQRRPTC